MKEQTFPLPPAIRFGIEEEQTAAAKWRFNCGPGALCGLLEMTPDQIKPYLGDFERKGYTNPKLMGDILKRLGAEYQTSQLTWPNFGLVRVQWEGPWTLPGVPLRKRYRHTHWVACCRYPTLMNVFIFDINAVYAGGWIALRTWHKYLVPWILKQCEPQANGQYSVTHKWEIITRISEKII